MLERQVVPIRRLREGSWLKRRMTRSSKPPRHWLKPRLKPWLPSFAGRYADLLAVVLLVTLTLVAEWNILNPRTLVGREMS